MFRVMFVCTANVCRSPMAEVILENIVKEHHLEDQIEVESSGIWASDGQPASELSRLVARENGLDLSSHRSQSVTPQLVKSSDLILCMTPSHKRDLLNIFPHFDNKIFTLKEYGRENPPQNNAIADPIGMNLNFYRSIFREIESEIKRIWPLIQNRARESKRLIDENFRHWEAK